MKTRKTSRPCNSSAAQIPGYESLANAIIISAVRDYKAKLKKEKNEINRESHMAGTIEEIFFKSSWFKLLTTIDGEYIIRELKTEVWNDDR